LVLREAIGEDFLEAVDEDWAAVVGGEDEGDEGRGHWVFIDCGALWASVIVASSSR
jgi:hypothetical protein